MDKIYYAFTVKSTIGNKMPQIDDYEAWIRNAKQNGFDVQCHYYELDSKGRLHIHGVAIAKKNFYKKSVMFCAYHQKIDEIPSWMDLQKWVEYIQKDYINEDEYAQMLIKYEIQTHDFPFSEARKSLRLII